MPDRIRTKKLKTNLKNEPISTRKCTKREQIKKKIILCGKSIISDQVFLCT